MPRSLRIALITAGAIVLIVLALVTYALLNLNSLIRDNRERVLARLSESLGRPVQISDVRAAVKYYGVVLDATGLRIADDPAFSQLPIIQADEVVGQANFLPLLVGRLHLSRVIIKEPEVRIITDERGELNLAKLGKKRDRSRSRSQTGNDPPPDPPAAVTESAGKPSRHKGARTVSPFVAMVSIGAFSIEDGTVSYRDLRRSGASIEVRNIGLEVSHFSASKPFDVALELAAFGNQQNITLRGKVGPLLSDGQLDPERIPFTLTSRLGPITLDNVREISDIGARIPADLSVSGPLVANLEASGTVDSAHVTLSSDLSANAIDYKSVLDKPAGVTLKLAASGARNHDQVSLTSADLILADLELKAHDMSLADGAIQAQVDTNHFDLSAPAKVIPAAARLGLGGEAEIHTSLRIAKSRPWAQGVIALSHVALKPPGGKAPAISDLTGNIRLTGDGAVIEPTTFSIGSSHARIQARADSFDPLRATLSLSADALNLQELVPSRKSGTPEQINALSINATADGKLAAPHIAAQVTSGSGSVANVAYRNLSASIERDGDRIDARALGLNAFGGAISASGQAILAATPSFDVKANLDNIDVEQALASQKAKAAGVVRGKLSGQAEIAGRGSNFDQIKPTLAGSGRAALRDGKLVGINVVGQAMKKIHGLPAIGDLVPPDVVARHPELFASPDTDIQAASLSFTLQGERIVSHDIDIRSPDYRLTGDGWFDMDKNIDLSARILLSKQLSDELEARKRNVVYLANRDGEVQIPLRVTGALPKPLVVPDIGAMANTAGKQAVQREAGKFLGRFLGGSKKRSGPGATPAPNPLAPLERLFH
jgi:uncharacterized protein involved in outer membrane biogenesis